MARSNTMSPDGTNTRDQTQQQVPRQMSREVWKGIDTWRQSVAGSKVDTADADAGAAPSEDAQSSSTTGTASAASPNEEESQTNSTAQRPAQPQQARQNEQATPQQQPLTHGQQALRVQQPSRIQRASRSGQARPNQRRAAAAQQHAQQQAFLQGRQVWQAQHVGRQLSPRQRAPQDQLHYCLDAYFAAGQQAAQPLQPTSNPPPDVGAQDQLALDLRVDFGEWDMRAPQPNQHGNGFVHEHASRALPSQQPGYPVQNQLALQPQQQPGHPVQTQLALQPQRQPGHPIQNQLALQPQQQLAQHAHSQLALQPQQQSAQFMHLARYHQDMQLRKLSTQQQGTQQQAENPVDIDFLLQNVARSSANQQAPQRDFSDPFQVSAGLSQAPQSQQPDPFRGSTRLAQPPADQAPVMQNFLGFDDGFQLQLPVQPQASPAGMLSGLPGQQVNTTGPSLQQVNPASPATQQVITTDQAAQQTPMRPGYVRPVSFNTFNAAFNAVQGEAPQPPANASGELRFTSVEGQRYISTLQADNRQLRNALNMMLQESAGVPRQGLH